MAQLESFLLTITEVRVRIKSCTTWNCNFTVIICHRIRNIF